MILTDAAAWKSSWKPNYFWCESGLGDYLDCSHFLWRTQTPIFPAINRDLVRDWLKKGAIEEDSPVTRSLNHFHDPLKPWDKAGLSLMGLFLGQSSVLWSQALLGQQLYSWKNAREYYYRALSAPTDEERQKAYALTFQTLGHIMHLVEDAAVPDHTRNDIHTLFSVEKWVLENKSKADEFISAAAYWSNLPPIFDLPILDLIGSKKAPVRISNLFDTNQYTGANPEITTSPTIGIAEYSNANFLSKGTIFAYEHPAIASTEPESSGKYVRKVKAGQQIEHFLSSKSDWPDDQENRTYTLDDRCHEDYAKLLLPKAAQYAAAIPQYFFRAVIECLYGGGTQVGITNTTDEVMTDGTIEIYLRKGGSWKQIGQALVKDFRPGEAMVVDLNCDSYWNPYTDPSYVVFRGTLGDEKGAVVGNMVMTVS